MDNADHVDIPLSQVDWQPVILAALAAAVDCLVETRQLPIKLADFMDDLGNALQMGRERMMRARQAYGLPLPDGPDDRG